MSTRPGGVAWWAPAPLVDPGPPIGVRRAYLEVAAVYLTFFGPSILAAVGSLAGVSYVQSAGWWLATPNVLQELIQAGLAVFVAVVLAARRERAPRQMGLAGPRSQGGPGVRLGLRMAAWAALAFVAGGIVTSALATGHFPFPPTTGANTLLELAGSAQAGVMEEVVVLAFLVTTLEQARRPRMEILAVAVLARMAYHIYYGVGVVGIAVWATVFVWLFWRYRSVIPLVITHLCWDSLVFLTRVSKAFGGLLALGLLALWVTGVVLWLVDRSGSGRSGVVDWGPPVGSPDGPASRPPVW